MEFYGIANTQGVRPIMKDLGKGLPDLLALGHRGEILPVFGTDNKLQAFVHRHPSLRADRARSVEPTLLGASFIELAELISPVVQAGKVETLIFDPVLNADGAWVGETLNWPAERFCDFMILVRSTVTDIARRKGGIPAHRQPSSEAVNEALGWYMRRIASYHLKHL